VLRLARRAFHHQKSRFHMMGNRIAALPQAFSPTKTAFRIMEPLL
jgi:hypothetical protein